MQNSNSSRGKTFIMHVNGMNMHKTSQNYKLHLFTHYYLCYYTRNPSTTPQRHFFPSFVVVGRESEREKKVVKIKKMSERMRG
jgi:hypothetical protein